MTQNPYNPECTSCGHPMSAHDEEHLANLCAGFVDDGPRHPRPQYHPDTHAILILPGGHQFMELTKAQLTAMRDTFSIVLVKQRPADQPFEIRCWSEGEGGVPEDRNTPNTTNPN